MSKIISAEIRARVDFSSFTEKFRTEIKDIKNSATIPLYNLLKGLKEYVSDIQAFATKIFNLIEEFKKAVKPAIVQLKVGKARVGKERGYRDELKELVYLAVAEGVRRKVLEELKELAKPPHIRLYEKALDEITKKIKSFEEDLPELKKIRTTIYSARDDILDEIAEVKKQIEVVIELSNLISDKIKELKTFKPLEKEETIREIIKKSKVIEQRPEVEYHKIPEKVQDIHDTVMNVGNIISEMVEPVKKIKQIEESGIPVDITQLKQYHQIEEKQKKALDMIERELKGMANDVKNNKGNLGALISILKQLARDLKRKPEKLKIDIVTDNLNQLNNFGAYTPEGGY